jgi:hypothetical protein
VIGFAQHAFCWSQNIWQSPRSPSNRLLHDIGVQSREPRLSFIPCTLFHSVMSVFPFRPHKLPDTPHPLQHSPDRLHSVLMQLLGSPRHNRIIFLIVFDYEAKNLASSPSVITSLRRRAIWRGDIILESSDDHLVKSKLRQNRSPTYTPDTTHFLYEGHGHLPCNPRGGKQGTVR